MTMWRLEVLRLTRTRRALILGVAFVFLGCSAPLLEYFADDIVSSAASDGVHVEMPPPSPEDGIGSYASNMQQLGLICVAAVAAASLCLDARPQTFLFYRLRVSRKSDILIPRYVVVTAACIVAYLLGLVGAGYETAVLIGDPGIPRTLEHGGLVCLYLAFAVAVVAAVASVLRSVLATVGCSLGLLLVALPALSAVDELQSWTPQTLAGSADPLLSGKEGLHEYALPAAVCVCLTALLLTVAASRVRLPVTRK
ncbi:ABC transporter permease [Streptomyces aureocirculatus]|uniref:ABC transporter permease n=1 Tax=Streptomyces aureocirculatus TaxID=67275 RepID=UPI0004C8EC89|nr:ABC transporter permease [Streptomyces aureocirculatus]